MIKYDPLWQTLKDKNISQYQLIKDYGIDKAQLQRLRQNMVVKTIILNRLCQILDCRIEDIMEYVMTSRGIVLILLSDNAFFVALFSLTPLDIVSRSVLPVFLLSP